MADLRLKESTDVMPVQSWNFVFQPTAKLPAGTVVILHGNFEADFKTRNPADVNKGWDREYPTTVNADGTVFEAEIPNLYIGQQYEYKFKIRYPDGRMVWWPNGKNSVVVIPEKPAAAAGAVPGSGPDPGPGGGTGVGPGPGGGTGATGGGIGVIGPCDGTEGTGHGGTGAGLGGTGGTTGGGTGTGPGGTGATGADPAPVPQVPAPAPPAPHQERPWGRILGIGAAILAAGSLAAWIAYKRGYGTGIEKNMDDVRGELFKRLVDKEHLEVPVPKIRVHGTVYRHRDNLVIMPPEQMVVMDKCGKAHPATIKVTKTRTAGNGFLEGAAVVQVATDHVIDDKVNSKSYTYALDDILLGDEQVRKWSSEATLTEE